MRLLLDTHIFLWYVTGDQRLSSHFKQSIEYADIAYVSVISLWEATIKYGLGKLPLPEPPHPWLQAQREHHGFEALPLTESSVSRLGTLPDYHKDPFDRMLVCQAIEHQLALVTVDPIIEQYPAQFLSPA